MELTDNIYHRNINNNSGIFDYLIGAAEEQECKEAFLAYHFLRIAPAPPTADELAPAPPTGCAKPSASTSPLTSERRQSGLSGSACSRPAEGGSLSHRSTRLVEPGRVWDGFFPRTPQITPQ